MHGAVVDGREAGCVIAEAGCLLVGDECLMTRLTTKEETKKRHACTPTHVPYTTVISHGEICTYNVILAGFKLDETSEKIPSRIIEALRKKSMD